jgi:pimeloyl-ACP methyl ester carboxylesterase
VKEAVRLDRMRFIEHELVVPLDHARPEGETITLFAREVVPVGAARDDLPMLVYLQGGPGGTAPRPRARDGWLGEALDRGYRVLLLDQRGTGRSALVDLATLDQAHPDAAAARLRHFRADGIVRDAEALRRTLLGDDGRWSLLGQSFGGFVALHYLSAAPEALVAVLITGGLPSLDRPAIDVYRATFGEVARKTRRHFGRYPGDEALLLELLAYARDHETLLPDGSPLTPGLVRSLGFALGSGEGREALHEALELAFVGEGPSRRPSYAFLRRLLGLSPFVGNPIFAVLHEAIYAQEEATEWAAQRALDELRAAGALVEPWLTGEMVLRDVYELAPLKPLRPVAERLAEVDDWPRLYDPSRLARNDVPVAAIAYADDMYVPLAYSRETAERVRGLHLWITNEYEHDGLRRDGARILGRLLDLLTP